MFKYEMHLHTCACSACGISSAEEMIMAAKESSYSGVAFTNHFYHGNTAIERCLDWREFVEAYREDFETAKEMGSKLDIDVFFGIEEVYEQGKEVLIYGISPELLADHPEFKDMRMPEIYKFVHANNGFISVAHPFRHVSYIPEPDKEPDVRYFDAVEVYNHSNSQEDNQKAYDFSKRNSLQTVSGGDIHIADKFGKSGLAFYERLYTPQNFVKALKENRYKLIINGEISE